MIILNKFIMLTSKFIELTNNSIIIFDEAHNVIKAAENGN